MTLNAKMKMPSWFDLKSLDPNGAEDEEGIKAAAEGIRKIIQEEVYIFSNTKNKKKQRNLVIVL